MCGRAWLKTANERPKWLSRSYSFPDNPADILRRCWACGNSLMLVTPLVVDPRQVVERPRARIYGRELSLPSGGHGVSRDPLDERGMEQMALGSIPGVMRARRY
jgi:hypothetical protein